MKFGLKGMVLNWNEIRDKALRFFLMMEKQNNGSTDTKSYNLRSG